MADPEPQRIDYFTPEPPTHPRWFGVGVGVLAVVQLAWICVWGVFTQGALPDGSPKEPLSDFFVEIGVAVPTIGIAALCLLRLLWGRWRDPPPPRGVAPVIALAIAVLLIAAVTAGWVWDDLINRDEPHGGWQYLSPPFNTRAAATQGRT